jgi:AcrR family transcriptional regulator
MVVEDRRSIRRQETIRELLDLAWRQIAEVGVGELSLRQLARDVGMQAPSLYVYFPSKNALYDALFADAAIEFQDGYRAATSARDAEEAVLEGLRFYLRFGLENPGKYQLHFQRPVPGFTPSEESFAIARETYELFVGTLRRMVEAGKLDARVLEQRSLDLLTAMSSGLASQQLANEPDATFEKGRWTSLAPTVFEMQKLFFVPRGRGKEGRTK